MSYFYNKRVGGASPLDEALSVGEDTYSDLVRETAEYLGVDVAHEKVVELFQHLLGQKLDKNAVQQMVEEDARDVEVYYKQKAAPDEQEEGSILVVQADILLLMMSPTGRRRRCCCIIP